MTLSKFSANISLLILIDIENPFYKTKNYVRLLLVRIIYIKTSLITIYSIFGFEEIYLVL